MVAKGPDDLAIIVENCRSGDREAWRELVARISPLIFSICGSMKLSREESFDIYGQVLYLILKNLHRLRQPDKLLSYVSTTTKREVYAFLRRSRFLDYIDDNDRHDTLEDPSERADEVHERLKRRDLLMQAMARLPKQDFEVLHALFLDSRRPDYTEAADMLNMPLGSLGPTRARSLRRLKKILKRSGFDF